jgi:hypothetical protein
MKRLLRAVLVLSFLLGASGVFPAAASPIAAPNGEDTPPPSSNSLFYNYNYYLPIIAKAPDFMVAGQVTDSNGAPVSGVTVVDSKGDSTYTAADGEYSLGALAGPNAIAPSKDGYMFDPPVIDLNVTGSVVGQDFTALTACNEAITNGGFEYGAWWDLLEYDYPSAYSLTVAHSGVRSVRTGILIPADNMPSYSNVRTPLISIPTGTTASLHMWLYPVSTEAAQNAPKDGGANESAFGDTSMLYDAQYVQVLNASDGVLATLLYFKSNNAFWTLHDFDLSPYAGQSIKIQIGAYNDGTSGITALYADDVSLEICGGTPPPPPPPGDCTNQMGNSGFEYNGSWGIPYTAYPAAYSTDYAAAGVRSMRTGIPYYTGANVYSYSDAWQTVYIPSNATSAKLKLWLYPHSQEATAMQETGSELPDVVGTPPKEGEVFGEEQLAYDAQYLLILNPYTGVTIQTLIWWQPASATAWRYREYDLKAYAGRYIRIQFGTYNDGWGGRTNMYVDEAYVDVCTGTPPPPPPGTCTERIGNGGFENNSAWYIPITAYSAGYSTWLQHTGARSMRTGIVYQSHNRYSYSDFRQRVTIPGNMNTATLSFYAYSMSGDWYSDAAAQDKPTATELGAQAMAGDVQYLLVLDSWGNWIDTLVWRRSNESYWRYFEYNLHRFIGSTIMLQWGTYNNGWDGVTSMYVDDVSLRTCP